MGAVLGREDDIFGGQTPVDAQRRVVPCNGALRFGGVGVVALVLERRFVAQHGKAVRKAPRDEELTLVVFRQLHRHVAAERGGAAADIHRDVEHAAPDHADQFRLGVPPFLEMEAPQHAVA